MSDLEKSWEETAKEINAKLKEATAALKEVNRLSGEAGVDFLFISQWAYDELSSEEVAALKIKLADIKDSVKELESQIDSAGWSTSSSHC